MAEYVIFAIDNGEDLRTQARFLRHLDGLRAQSKLSGPVRLCVGSYKGALENSYQMTLEDYILFVEGKGWADWQESVLRIRGVDLFLLFRDGSTQELGEMGCSVHQPQTDGWTYFLDSRLYMYATGVMPGDRLKGPDLFEIEPGQGAA